MEAKELAAMMELPPPSWRGHYTVGDMRAYALVHLLAERDKWRRILAARDEDDRHEEIRYQTLRAAAKMALAALGEERSQYGDPLAHVEEAIAALEPLVAGA